MVPTHTKKKSTKSSSNRKRRRGRRRKRRSRRRVEDQVQGYEVQIKKGRRNKSKRYRGGGR
jgi:hypothetical protein